MPATLQSNEQQDTETSQTEAEARNDRTPDRTADLQSITQPIPDSIFAWVGQDGYVYSFDIENNKPKKQISKWVIMESKFTSDFMVISHRGWRWIAPLNWPPFGPSGEYSGSFVYFKRDIRIASDT